jgi:hypothetical protein
MNIEDRMSLWAAKRPREEPAELMLEGAQEIADLRRHREEDGKQMSVLIEGYQKMQALCVDGKYLTDEERKAIEMSIAACEVEKELNIACDGRQSFAGLWSDRTNVLRSLLERFA